ncbi:MAG: extracellular solute-binding protein [bacterium]
MGKIARSERLVKLGLLILSVVLIAAFVMVLGTSESTAEKVTLRVQTRGDEGSMERDRIRIGLFEKNFPNIKINMEPFPGAKIHEFDAMLNVAYAAGNAPDLVCLDFEPLEHVLLDQVLPLSPFMAKDEKFKKFKFWHPGQLAQFTYGGQVYAFPRGLYTYVIWINENMFDEVGLQYPQWGYTTDDFVQMGKKLTRDVNGDGRIDQYGYEWGGNFSHQDVINWYPEILGKSFWIFDKETGWVSGSNLKDPAVIEAIQWNADLVAKYKISPSPELGDLSKLGMTFQLGKMGMTFGATWSIGGNRANIGKRFRWTPYPFPVPRKGLEPKSMLLQRPTGAIMASTKHPEEAWIFLREYSGYEQEKLVFDTARTQEFGGPAFADSLILEDWINQDPPGPKANKFLLDMITENHIWWSPENLYPRGYEEWLSVYKQELEPVRRGQKTAEQAISEFFDKANASIVWDAKTKERIEKFLKKSKM